PQRARLCLRSRHAGGVPQLTRRLQRPSVRGSHARCAGGHRARAIRARREKPKISSISGHARVGWSWCMQERVKKPKLPTKPHEELRIAGKLVDSAERTEVRNPYTGAVIGTVAAASPAQVAQAFKIGNDYKSK